MKLLVVGGGGREHAIIKKLKESPLCTEIWAAPGNGGIACDARCREIPPPTLRPRPLFAKEEGFDYVVVAPDDPWPWAWWISWPRRASPPLGPAAAARIEASKVFSKDLMKKYGIPTAGYGCLPTRGRPWPRSGKGRLPRGDQGGRAGPWARAC